MIRDGVIENINIRSARSGSYSKIELYLLEHSKEDYALFRDVQNALGTVLPQFVHLGAEYVDLAATVTRLSRQLSIDILFIQNRITADQYKARLAEIFENDQEIISGAVNEIEFEKGDQQRATVALHQFRDEVIQIAAILQSVFQQGLAGLPPILNSPYQAGTFSLLGIGGMYAALMALYSHVHAAFSTIQPERIVRDVFATTVAPPLPPQADKYEEWRSSLHKFSSIKHARHHFDPRYSFYHLLYFSNRLGFRATKLSITAAYQSIYLGMMPSWNLSTIFHEFLHSHVKAVMAELFPLDESVVDAAYRNYEQRDVRPNSAANLVAFFQLLILDTVSALYGTHSGKYEKGRDRNLPIAKCLPKETLVKELARQHDQIDELFVHVLDLNYFYQSDAETYIRSIWSSWLTLPFVTRRIDEYALRTICTIASVDDGRRIDRFSRAPKTLTTQLETLKCYDFIDGELLGVVLKQLNESDRVSALRTRFFVLIGLADAIAEFLVFPTMQPLLFRELSDTLQDDSSFGYAFTLGEYSEEVIESPVKFLMNHLKATLAKWDSTQSSAESDFFTLWSFQAISSTLQAQKPKKKRKASQTQLARSTSRARSASARSNSCAERSHLRAQGNRSRGLSPPREGLVRSRACQRD